MLNKQNIFVQYSFSKTILVMALIMVCSIKFASAQIKECEEECEEESNSVLFLDSLVVASHEVIYDPTFNYNFDSTLINDDKYIRAGLLYDVESNCVTWQKDMNYAYPIASVTKIMTGILTLIDIEAGRAAWDDKISITTKSYKGRGKRRRAVYYTSNYTLRDLTKMLMIESNNYAANLIAQHLGNGDMNVFVKRMNEYAVGLCMHQTYYNNPSGLPASRGGIDNNSSPHDLLLLALEALKYPELMGIATMGYADVSNGKSTYTIRNHNGLVRDYQNEIDGLKTGFTRAAGFCVIVTGNRYNHRLISIVLGAPSVYSRNGLVSEMMTNYYQKVGLGQMGTRLPDSVLAIIKPGLTNEMFAYRAGAVKPAPVIDAHNDMEGAITFKTTYVKIVQNHKVRSGENLSTISNKYNCEVATIKKLNHLKSTKLLKGQNLKVYATVKRVIPVKSYDTSLAVHKDSANQTKDTAVAAITENTKDTVKKSNVSEASNASKNISKYIYYVVQPGDTLWNIAQRYQGVSVTDLRKHNKNITAHGLKAGAKIKVPVSK